MDDSKPGIQLNKVILLASLFIVSTSFAVAQDTTSPTYQNLNDNVSGVAAANQPLNIWAEWKDDGAGLADTKLSVNNSGQFQNVSTKSFGQFPFTGVSYDISNEVSGRYAEDIYFDGAYYWVLIGEYDALNGNSETYVYRYDSSWSYTGTNYNLGSQISGSELAKSLFKGDNGNWYVSDSLGSAVHEFDSSWNYQSTIDVSNQALTPRGIYQDSTGTWWVLDADSERVYKYDSSWSYTDTYYDLHFGVSQPKDISKGDNGNWWVLDTGQVHKYETSWTFGGSYTGTSYELEGTDNRGLNQDDNGYWHVTENNTDLINEYTNKDTWLNQSFSYSPSLDGVLGYRMWQSDEEGNWGVTSTGTQEVDGGGPNYYNVSIAPNESQPGTKVDINSTWLDNGTGLSKVFLSLDQGKGLKNYTDTPVVEEETFEDGVIGSKWGGNVGNLSATSSNVISGDYSGRLNATGGGESIVSREFNDTTGSVKVLSYDILIDEDTNNENNEVEIIIYDEDDDYTAWIQFDDRDQTVNPVIGNYVGSSNISWEVGKKIDVKTRFNFEENVYRTYIDGQLLIGSDLGTFDDISAIQFINTMDGADSSTVRNVYLDNIEISNRTYGSPWLFDSSTAYQDVNFTYQNQSFAGKLNYNLWGKDTGGNYNSTGLGEIRFLQTFNESYSQQIDMSTGIKQSQGLLELYSTEVNTSEKAVTQSDLNKSREEDVQVIGDKNIDASLEYRPIQSINLEEVAGEVIEYSSGSIASFNIVGSQDEDPRPTIRDITVFNKDYSDQYRLESEQVHVRVETTHPLGRNNLDTALVSLTDPSGIEQVTEADMNYIQDVNNGKMYEFNYTLPSASSAGNWTVDISVNDTNNDFTASTDHFIYQNVGKSKGVPNQGSADIYDDVPFTNSFTATNPSDTDFVDALVNVSIPSDTVLSTVVLEKPDGTDVPIKTLSDSYFTYVADSISAQSSNDYTLAYSVEGSQVQKSNTTYLQDNKNIQDIRFNLTTSGPTDFQDLTHSFKISNPERITSRSLYVNGTEVSLDGDYGFDTVDSDGDGVGDTVEFTVPELEDRSDYLVRLIRGEPLQIERGNSVLNEPVTENKIIEWRKGLRFYNPNSFSFSTQHKVRLPLRSSSIEVEGEFTTKSFDSRGAYVPVQLDFDPNENITRYVRFTTPSIDISQVTDQPEIYWINKANKKTINVTFENPYSLTVTDAEDSVGILEGSNLVVRNEEGDTVAEEELVEGNYIVNTSEIPPSSTETLNLEFNVPVANSSFIGTSNTSSGTRISAWDIASESPVSRQPTRFSTDRFDCVEAKRAFVVDTNETLELICDGDNTVVDIGNLGPNEEFKLGVEWRSYHPVFNDVRILYQTLGSNIFAIGLGLTFLITILATIYSYVYGISIAGISDLKEIIKAVKEKLGGLTP